jgi:NADH-quinone oxidoreductase subunit J
MAAALVATVRTLPDVSVFVAGALMILAGALGVISMRNPVHSALSLVLTLFGIAVLFIEQQADFLAAVQVIVYAGAIVVLFLFVIMFLGVDENEDTRDEPLIGQRPVAVVLVVTMVASIIALGTEAKWATGPHNVTGKTLGPYQNIGELGRSVFTTYLFAFEATAALLIIAVVGAVVLARRSGRSTAQAGFPGTEDAVGELGEEVDR